MGIPHPTLCWVAHLLGDFDLGLDMGCDSRCWESCSRWCYWRVVLSSVNNRLSSFKCA